MRDQDTERQPGPQRTTQRLSAPRTPAESRERLEATTVLARFYADDARLERLKQEKSAREQSQRGRTGRGA